MNWISGFYLKCFEIRETLYKTFHIQTYSLLILLINVSSKECQCFLIIPFCLLFDMHSLRFPCACQKFINGVRVLINEGRSGPFTAYLCPLEIPGKPRSLLHLALATCNPESSSRSHGLSFCPSLCLHTLMLDRF